jgi:two-component sensor histidine kinase
VDELISNSLKHTFQNRARGEIRIRGRYLDPGIVRLTIADDGAGLPPGVVFGGSGTLGLELVKSLAGQLDANIETRNQGRGIRFDVAC